MIDPTSLSDNELNKCVDEYFQRIVNSIRNTGLHEQAIQLSVNTTQYRLDNEYEIEHTATVGELYGKNQRSTTNNLMKSAHNAASNLLEQMIDAPRKIVPQLTHQKEPEHEEAEYAEVSDEY